MKTYEKPQIFFESFEVSQHVAACGWDMSNLKSLEECTAMGDPEFGNDDPSVPAFIGSNVKCQFDPQLYCFENGSGTDAIKVFNS